MIKIEEVLSDSGRATADMVVELIAQRPELFDEAYRLCMLQEGKMSMRAARVVWLIAEQMPGLFKPYLPEIVEMLPFITHTSVKRCMLKILSVFDLSDHEKLHGHIIEECFRNMLAGDAEIAIRGYSIAVLDKMVKTYPEISGELISAYQILIESGPETLVRYSNKKLKELYKSAIP